MVTGVSTQEDPTFENNYLVRFTIYPNSDELDMNSWHNPLDPSEVKIISWIPQDNSALLETFRSRTASVGFETWINDGLDVFSVICTFLGPKDLASLSKVSSAVYVAAKLDSIWNFQLNNLLANVRCLPTQTCSMCPHQQFQVVYKKISDHQKPYIVQLEHFSEMAVKKEERLKEIAEREDCDYRRTTVLNIEAGGHQLQISSFAASMEVVAESNSLKRCILALNSIPEVFNNQDKFEDIIRTAEVAQQTAPVVLSMEGVWDESKAPTG